MSSVNFPGCTPYEINEYQELGLMKLDDVPYLTRFSVKYIVPFIENNIVNPIKDPSKRFSCVIKTITAIAAGFLAVKGIKALSGNSPVPVTPAIAPTLANKAVALCPVEVLPPILEPLPHLILPPDLPPPINTPIPFPFPYANKIEWA